MLTPKQEKFVTEYLQHGNATQAYKTAFGTRNDNSARASASKLLRNPDVAARVVELQAKVTLAGVCTAEEIQKRLSSIARREETETVHLPNGGSVQRQASIRDATRALELLAKINGLLVAKQEIDLSGALPVIIKDDL